MRKYIGTAETVGQLIELLKTLPEDKLVRCPSPTDYGWPPEVRDHERCVTVGLG